MILPPGDQSLMTFLFDGGVTSRLSYVSRALGFFSFLTTIDVNYVSNGSRDTLPLITCRRTSSARPRFNNYTSYEINSASVACVIIKVWRYRCAITPRFYYAGPNLTATFQ